MPDQAPVFILGLTLAGAISAGAYTAGVLEQLFRALEAHEAAFRSGEVKHRVVLKVMSGTSAGGVSAALAVAALAKGLDAQARRYVSGRGGAADYDVRLGPLHEVWVERLTLTDGRTGGLLGLSDLGPDRPVVSLLDSGALDAAADAALSDVVWKGRPYQWIARELEVFLTATNLNGAPYAVRFGGPADARHAMTAHAAARQFRVSGLGVEPIGSRWLDEWRATGLPLALKAGADVSQPLDFARREPADGAGTNWTALRETALATGAFPLGLAARVLHATRDEFGPIPDGGAQRGGAWPLEVDPETGPHPDWPPGGESFPYVAVDGGVCNNEPFEYARYTLRPADDAAGSPSWALKPNPRSALEADRAVLMIDPFPDARPVIAAEPADVAERALLAVLGPLVGSLIAQARLKPGELVAAADGEVRSRFLISPSRGEGDDRVQGAEAIACGALSGFGGFLDEAFRAHDHLLGRHNCQSFLRRHFMLDARNAVFAKPDAAEGERPVLASDGGGLDGRPGDAPEPDWPAMTPERLAAVDAAAGRRLDGLFEALLRTAVGVKLARWGLRRIWSLGLGEAARRRVRRAIEAEVIRRDQLLLDWPDGADATLRRTLAEIVGSSISLRSSLGVALALAERDALAAGRRPPAEPPEALLAEVRKAVALLRTPQAPKGYRLDYVRGRGDRALHHLKGRGPGFWRKAIPGLAVDDDLPA